MCELAAPRVRRGRQRSFVSLSFLSPYIRILYHGWTFCPRFCTHNLCRHILSFVRAAGERNGAGAKKSSRLPSSICMSQVCALLAFGLENFRSFCDIKRNFYTSSTQGQNAHILIAVCSKTFEYLRCCFENSLFV